MHLMDAYRDYRPVSLLHNNAVAGVGRFIFGLAKFLVLFASSSLRTGFWATFLHRVFFCLSFVDTKCCKFFFENQLES